MENATIFFNLNLSSSSSIERIYNETISSTGLAEVSMSTDNYHEVFAIGILLVVFNAIAFSLYICSIQQHSSVSFELERAYVTVRPGEKTSMKIIFVQPSFGFGFPLVQTRSPAKIVYLSVSLFQPNAPILTHRRLTLNSMTTRYTLELDANLLEPGATYSVRADVIQNISDGRTTDKFLVPRGVAVLMEESKPIRSTDFYEAQFTACMQFSDVATKTDHGTIAAQERTEEKREALFEP